MKWIVGCWLVVIIGMLLYPPWLYYYDGLKFEFIGYQPLWAGAYEQSDSVVDLTRLVLQCFVATALAAGFILLIPGRSHPNNS